MKILYFTTTRKINQIIENLCHDLAKQLSYYLYLLFFCFSFGLTTQKGVWESVMSQVSHSYGYMTGSHSIMSHDGSHDKCGKVVHKPCSSYISSVQKNNGNSIEFSLSTQIRSEIKLS